MALLPETVLPETISYASFNPSNNVYMDDMDLYNAQVFTVTELPQGPAVDRINTDVLSGKPSIFAGSYSNDEECKNESPTIERMPPIDKVEIAVVPQDSYDDDSSESDPCFALFRDCPSPRASLVITEDPIFGHLESEKAFGRLELIIEDEIDQTTVSVATMEKFERLCSSLEAASDRISNIVPQLSRL